jgi:hypothetical protein
MAVAVASAPRPSREGRGAAMGAVDRFMLKFVACLHLHQLREKVVSFVDGAVLEEPFHQRYDVLGLHRSVEIVIVRARIDFLIPHAAILYGSGGVENEFA